MTTSRCDHKLERIALFNPCHGSTVATMTPRAAARALVFLVLLGAAGAVSLKRATEEHWNFNYNLHVLPSPPNACKERETCLDVGADQLP